MNAILDDIWFFAGSALGLFAFLYMGYIILHFLPKSKQFPLLQKFSIAYGLGTGLNSIFMFFSILVGINSRFSALPFLAFTVFLGFYFKINKQFLVDINRLVISLKNKLLAVIRKKEKYHPLIWVCFILLGIETIFIFSNWIIEPFYMSDSVVIWDAHAKYIFFDGNLNYLVQKASTHNYYPLLVPLNMTFFYSIYLQPSNYAGILFISYFYCIIVCLYYSLKKFGVHKNGALLMTIFVASLPQMYFYSNKALGDLPETYFYSVAILFMLSYVLTKEKPYLIYSILFHAFMAWTRSEAIVVLVVDFAILGGYHLYSLLKTKDRENFKLFKIDLLALACAVFIYLPWIVITSVNGVGESNQDNFSIPLLQFYQFENLFNIQNYLTVAKFIVLHAEYSTRIVLFLFIIVLLFNLKKIFNGPTLILLIFILFYIAIKIFGQIMYPTNLLIELGNAFDRQVMPVIPIIVFLCGVLLFNKEVFRTIVPVKIKEAQE